MRTLTPALLLAAFAASSISEAKVPNEISVELASVTLAEDCGGTIAPPKPTTPPTRFAKPPPATADAKSERAPSLARGSCAGPGQCGPARRACEQTSMQIVFNAQSGVRPTTIKIKRVELLDSKGKVLEVLGAHNPKMWSAQSGVYVGWDEALGGNDVIRASYALNAPNWNKHVGGRMHAHAHTFQLRVTVTIGNSERTVEKTSITPARIAPLVVT
jgi:hypothetical protein